MLFLLTETMQTSTANQQLRFPIYHALDISHSQRMPLEDRPNLNGISVPFHDVVFSLYNNTKLDMISE